MTYTPAPYITVYKPIAGWKAIMYWWNNEESPGFWEPWQTGMCGHATREQAEAEARSWAEAEEIKYYPLGEAPSF